MIIKKREIILGCLIFIGVMFSDILLEEEYELISPISEDHQFKQVPVVAQEKEDKRIEALEKAFAQINSPLEEKSAFLVNLADKHGLDYRLIPAISFVESSGCKNYPAAANNCFGYGNPLWEFDSIEAGARQVVLSLTKSPRYQAYRDDPENLGTLASIYCPVNQAHWVEVVNYFYELVEKGDTK